MLLITGWLRYSNDIKSRCDKTKFNGHLGSRTEAAASPCATGRTTRKIQCGEILCVLNTHLFIVLFHFIIKTI